MSAENSRLTRAIQRIAREDPDLRRAIEATKPRGDQPGGTGVGESDGERDRICCDGSTSGSANPGTSERDPDANAKDGLDSDDPADISDNLSGVVDCATGQPICFEGSDWIPPEGWEDARTPPKDGFEDGFVWRHSSGGSFYGETPLAAFFNNLNNLFGCSPGTLVPGRQDVNDDDRVCWRGFTCDTAQGGGLRCSVKVDESEAEGQDVYSIPEDWGEDGCVSIAALDGRLVGSRYDPENDGSYSAPRDEIELCDPDNGTRILIRADTGSTWKSIKSLDGDIDPDTGYGYLYDSASGKKIRQISPSEFRDNAV